MVRLREQLNLTPTCPIVEIQSVHDTPLWNAWRRAKLMQLMHCNRRRGSLFIHPKWTRFLSLSQFKGWINDVVTITALAPLIQLSMVSLPAKHDLCPAKHAVLFLARTHSKQNCIYECINRIRTYIYIYISIFPKHCYATTLTYQASKF